MAQRRFNKIVVGITALVPAGVTLNPGDFVSGGGTVYLKPQVTTVTTLNHLIHRVPIEEKGECTVSVWGDKESLASQATGTDMGNFGGTHKFYLVVGLVETLVAQFDGLVDAVYNPDTRQTKLTFTGEFHGLV